MNRIKRLILVLVVVLACTGCDQTTKYFAANLLAPHSVISCAADTFRFEYTENTGAFLSIGKNLSDEHRFSIFTVAVALALSALFVYIVLNMGLETYNVIAFAIILGGGTGNLYDRITNNGAVIDFLNIGFGQLRTGIFNIADVLILLGVAMLLLHLVAGSKSHFID